MRYAAPQVAKFGGAQSFGAPELCHQRSPRNTQASKRQFIAHVSEGFPHHAGVDRRLSIFLSTFRPAFERISQESEEGGAPMPRPTPDEVTSTLTSYGSKIENFNQNESERTEKFNDTRLTEGYCEGVCLDWIRRVLQGGRPAFSPQAIKGQNPEETRKKKIQSQAARQAHAFLNWEYIMNQLQDQKAPVVKQRYEKESTKAKFSKIDALEALEADLLQLINSTTTTQTTVDLTPQLQNQITQCLTISLPRTNNVTDLIRLHDAIIPTRKQDINATKPDPREILSQVRKDVRQDAWNQFSALSSGFSPKKRSFKNISLLSSEPTQQNLTRDTVIRKLNDVGTKDIQSYRAVKINIGGTQAGDSFFHSTASYLDPGLGTNKYLFLDPNFGIFAYADWKNVLKALLYLYTKVYNWKEVNQDVPITNYNLQIEIFSK
jgi:hypothetical protein